MANRIAVIIWGVVAAIALLGWVIKESVITWTPEAPKTVEPLVMGISPSACRHLIDIGRTDDFFACMGIEYVTSNSKPKTVPKPLQRD